MQVTTIEEARALVGRTFERDGERREIVWVDTAYCIVEFISRKDWNKNKRTVGVKAFMKWLSKAREVTE